MANYIGPITLDHPHVREGDEIKPDGSETINVVCSPIQAKQLLGLAENVVKNDYGPVRIIKGLNTRWGVLPVNTSENLKINEGSPHVGFYILGDPEEEVKSPILSLVKIPAEMISRNLNEYLTLLYSKGGEDGSTIESGYEDTEEVTVFEDTFDSAYTGNWNTYETYYMTSASVSTSGGKLVLTGTNNSGAAYGAWGRIKTTSKFSLQPPFTVEFDLEYGSGTYSYLNLIMVPSLPQPWNLTTNTKTSNYIRFAIHHKDGKFYLLAQRCKAGTVTSMIHYQQLNFSTEKNPNFKVKVTESGYMEIYVDKSGGTNFGNPVWKGNTGLSWKNYYFIYEMQQYSFSTVTMRSGNFKAYEEVDANKPNVVVAPPQADCNMTPDFTRSSEEGNIQCFQDITDPLNYQISPADFYKGTVKAMNGNYTDSVYRLITHNEVDLDPTKFYVSNGLIKLVTTTNGVQFQYWNGSGYVTLNTFTLPDSISLIRPWMVTPWWFVLQLDRTYWHIRAGKPYIWVKHEYDDLSYTVGTVYYHDDTLINPSGSGTVEISMLTQPYTTVFTPYNLFQSNVYTGTDTLLDTTGFTPQGSATLSSSTTHPYGGSRSLYANCPAGTSHGLLTESVNIKSGDWNACRVHLTGSGTCILQLNERNSAGSIIGGISSSPITLTTTPTRYTLLHKFSDLGVKASVKVLNNSESVGASIYADEFSICPAYNGITYPGTVAPDSANEKALMIMKKDPTTILSGSIPASSMTGLGVYDQMRPPSHPDHFKSLMREWHNQTRQALALQSI